MKPAAPPRGKVTRVAVGVLIRADGWVLLADRPPGKPYAGYWEFPGGKIEPGEEVAAALERELHEELGIDIGPSVPWVTFEFDYPHAYVELQFRASSTGAAIRMRAKGNTASGRPPARSAAPVLPATVPVLAWLRLPVVCRVGCARNWARMPSSLARRGGAGAPPLSLTAESRGARCLFPVVDADWRPPAQGAVEPSPGCARAGHRRNPPACLRSCRPPTAAAAGRRPRAGAAMRRYVEQRPGGAWVGLRERCNLPSGLAVDLVRSAAAGVPAKELRLRWPGPRCRHTPACDRRPVGALTMRNLAGPRARLTAVHRAIGRLKERCRPGGPAQR